MLYITIGLIIALYWAIIGGFWHLFDRYETYRVERLLKLANAKRARLQAIDWNSLPANFR